MTLGLHLPFRRRRSRWERIKGAVAGAGILGTGTNPARRLRDSVLVPDTASLRDALPDPAELARRAQPLVQRVAAARPDVSLADAPDLLQEGLERLSSALGRKRPSRTERVLNADVPLWLALGVGLGALALGYVLGQAAASGNVRVPSVNPEDLEAAADKIKERWPAVHDDDIREARGNLKRLSSVVAERTGENIRSVQERLTALTGRQSSNGQS